MSEEFKSDFTEADAAKFLCRLCRDNERQAFAAHRLAEQALSNAHNDNPTPFKFTYQAGRWTYLSMNKSTNQTHETKA